MCVDIHRSISLVNDLKAVWALYKYFKAEKFDVVHSVTPKAGLVTALAGWLARVPRRVHIFTGQVWATKTGSMRFLLKSLDKLIAMLNTNLLVDGEGQRQFLIQQGVLKDSNSCVLANGSITGVELDKFVTSDEVRSRERESFGFKDSDVVYAFLGRLNHDKGIGELYAAFDKLVSEYDNAKLVFYGTDEEGYDPKADSYPNIKRGVNYFFPGRTSQPFEALQVADVFVIPTWREGFGMSIIEAQGLGLPVITSDAYGVVDASVEGETGLRCKVGDVESLYESMGLYHNNPTMRAEHGSAGRKRVEELYDNKVVTQAWVEYYKTLLN
jgi:glycosyltransferase involved in cell wall biosynthesis